MKVYIHPKCSTCKKALAFLEKNKSAFETVDIRELPPTYEELLIAFKQHGSLRKLTNTSGDLYKELGLKDTIDSLSFDEHAKLLMENGMLVKRPFLVVENTAHAGFNEECWSRLLQA